MTCFVCKLKGHYSKSAVCQENQTQPRAADELEEEEKLRNLYLESDSAWLDLDCIDTSITKETPRQVDTKVNSVPAAFKLNTGVAVTAMPASLRHCISTIHFIDTCKSFEVAGNHNLKIVVFSKATISVSSKSVLWSCVS